jgi:hypothetical protein
MAPVAVQGVEHANSSAQNLWATWRNRGAPFCRRVTCEGTVRSMGGLLLVACRTLDAYTVQGEWDRKVPHG